MKVVFRKNIKKRELKDYFDFKLILPKLFQNVLQLIFFCNENCFKKKHKEKRIERLTQKQKKNWKIEKFISNLFCQSIFRKKERKFDRFKKFDFDSLPKI